MVFCADRSWADAPEIGSSADKGLICDAEVCRSTAKEVLEKISFSASRSEAFFFMLDYAMKEGLFLPCGRKGESLSCSRNGKGGFPPVLYNIRGKKNYSEELERMFIPRLEGVGSGKNTRRENGGGKETKIKASCGEHKGLKAHPIPYEEYEERFSKVEYALHRGDSFLLNLTCRTPVETELDFTQVFFLSKAPYRVCIPDEFVCFSPEIFIRIENPFRDGNPLMPPGQALISTYPMKGTIPASVPDAARLLMENYKEQCEHATVVDLLRNDLSMVAHDVRVDRYRYLDRIQISGGKDIFQTSSQITGVLEPGWESRLGYILRTMLPAGSICGAPKPSTLKWISAAEPDSRGWYTGICGYFDGRNLDSAVMIRALSQDTEGNRFYHSGGGITVHSSARDEYDEMLAKIYLPI